MYYEEVKFSLNRGVIDGICQKQKRLMKIAFGGGMGKRKIREIKDRKRKQAEQGITQISGLRGGGLADGKEAIKDQDILNIVNMYVAIVASIDVHLQ